MLHPLSNIIITNYFNYKRRLKYFLIDNLPKIKDGAHVINIDDKQSKGIHWISLLINKNTAVVFDTFGIEYIPEEILRQIKDKTIAHNIFRIQSYDTFKLKKNM